MREIVALGIKYLSTASGPKIPTPAAEAAKFMDEPIIIPSKTRFTASMGWIPAPVIIGRAIEPTMIRTPDIAKIFSPRGIKIASLQLV